MGKNNSYYVIPVNEPSIIKILEVCIPYSRDIRLQTHSIDKTKIIVKLGAKDKEVHQVLKDYEKYNHNQITEIYQSSEFTPTEAAL